MAALQPTSQVPFFSSVHGAERRTQRNITKRDLQAAIKYGTSTRVRGNTRPFNWKYPGPTWIYHYANITYVTTDDSTQEITSYVDPPLPLEKVPISKRLRQQYDEAKKRITAEPWSITSHTVLIVDKSASMLKSDIDGHRTRARGAYYVLAEEYVAKQLHPLVMDTLGGTKTRDTDVVTLIEMRDDATIIFEREPLSWIVYNAFVDRASVSDKRFGDCKGHGNYLPTVASALALLEKNAHEKLAMTLYFMTDGKPSDFSTSYDGFPSNMLSLLSDFSKRYHDRFTFEAFGLGSDNFTILESMVDIVKAAGAVGKFGNGGRDLIAFCDSVTSVASSTTSITSMLSRLNFKKESRELASFERELYVESNVFNADNWNLYVGVEQNGIVVVRSEREFVQELPSGVWRPKWLDRPFLSDKAVGFAVKKKMFGEGAERIVFEMTEIDASSKPVGIPLVAKDSKYVNVNAGRSRHVFHKIFIETQMKASNLATKFSTLLDNKGVDKMIPRIRFLPCSIYDCNSAASAYLAEQRLNPDNYTKWNDNAGGLDGIARCNIAPVVGALATFEEGDEEDDEGEEDEEDEAADEDGRGLVFEKSPRDIELEGRILVKDIPQAFSHWTFHYSKRDFLVCDLQGELGMTGSVPCFDLTDPCIHSKGRGRRYGATDKGGRGVTEFFSTHHCNPLCELLRLTKT